jgi:hypothetical protein
MTATYLSGLKVMTNDTLELGKTYVEYGIARGHEPDISNSLMRVTRGELKVCEFGPKPF